MKVINIFSNYTPDLLLQLANKAIKIKTLNAEALKSYIKLEWSNPIGREKPAITKKQWTTWSVVVRLSLSSAMFSPMKMFGFSNRMFSSSSIQSRHFFHMSGYRGASGWISNIPLQEKILWRLSFQLVPSWRLPSWGCSRTGRRWCWTLFSPWRLGPGCAPRR